MLVFLFFLTTIHCFSQKKVDTLSKESFEILFEKYHTNAEFRRQYFALKKYVDFDSIPKEDLDKLLESIAREYELEKLSLEREKLLNKVKEKERNSRNMLLYLLLLSFLMIGFIFIFLRRKNKSQFTNNTLNKLNKEDTTSFSKKRKIVVSDEVSSEILENLKNFEKENFFLSSSITLNSLAKELNTNASYLSKTINYEKGQSFTKYLTELRVQYAIKKLNSDMTFRKYTIKAIAEESGFKTSESFARAFEKTTGVKPSKYLKKIG